jgi:hypothetical protein
VAEGEVVVSSETGKLTDTTVDVRGGHVCVIANGGIIRMLTADEARWLAGELTRAAEQLASDGTT